MENELQLLQDKNERLEEEITGLLAKLQLAEKENGELKKENKELKEKIEEFEVDKVLEETRQEADKLDNSLKELKEQVEKFTSKTEIPPK
ncbi:MAG: hypothetical protein I3273_05105 [Candidatus Moeniiplasma glomeromycotorum]|nr:hypothetical protein [Candidatus Moeniiplasma glomeromycotorum]MCE8169471.1 hypothetical protein [Candidatus Moeniiplasma glomeromycotorum]